MQKLCPGKFKRLEESIARGYEPANKLSEMDAGVGIIVHTIQCAYSYCPLFPVINQTKEVKHQHCINPVFFLNGYNRLRSYAVFSGVCVEEVLIEVS